MDLASIIGLYFGELITYFGHLGSSEPGTVCIRQWIPMQSVRLAENASIFLLYIYPGAFVLLDRRCESILCMPTPEGKVG